MIEFIGNYFDWVKPEWLQEVEAKRGFDMPKDSLRNEARFNPILYNFLGGDVTKVHTKEEFPALLEHLETLDPNDPIVKHAKVHVQYLNPDFEFDDEYRIYGEAGYEIFGTYFTLLEKFDVSFNILDNPPPFLDYKGKHITWWFSKMLPGQRMPMHIDRARPDVEINKYWMPWTDYQPGHIFTIGNKVLTNYKAGDVYRFDYAGERHGACNIGHSHRIVLQITDYKPSRNIDALR